MEQSSIGRPPGNLLLEQVHQGMRVLDSNGKDLGRVEDVYLGATSQTGAESGTGAATPGAHEQGPTGMGVAESLNEVPDVIRRRLERVGFIRICGGLLGRDRYADPDQI